MATTQNNIVNHKKGLGNDFVSAGFSISRNEITTMTEPRYNQHVSLTGIGLNSVTISQLPELVFEINTSSPFDIKSVNANTEGLFDKSMLGTWSNLKIEGDFLSGASTDTSQATFNFDVVEQRYAEYQYDFLLDKEVIMHLPDNVSEPFEDFLLNELVIPLSSVTVDLNDNGIQLAEKVRSAISDAMDLVVSKSHYVSEGDLVHTDQYTENMNATLGDTSTSLPLISWDDPDHREEVSWFGGVYVSGTRVKIQVVVNPDGTIPSSDLFRKNTRIMGFTELNYRPAGCYTTATEGVSEVWHPPVTTGGCYVNNALNTTHDTELKCTAAVGEWVTNSSTWTMDSCPIATAVWYDYNRSNDSFEKIRADIPDIIASRYVLDKSSLFIVNSGSSYKSTKSPYIDWASLTKDIFGTVFLDKEPDVVLQDIELMSITGSAGGSTGTIQLSRLLQDDIYRGGDFLFSHPTETHPFGFVSFLTPQQNFRTLDLKYFIDPIKYPEYEHGLLQQLATDLCLHPYGNRYTENWTNINQKLARLAMTQLTPGNNRVAYMPFDISIGTDAGWTDADVGKTIRERNGAGEAIITGLGSSDTIRLTPVFDISFVESTTLGSCNVGSYATKSLCEAGDGTTTGVWTPYYTLGSVGTVVPVLEPGYGLVQDTDVAGAAVDFVVRVTSDDPTSTDASLEVTVSDAHIVTAVTVGDPGLFLLPQGNQEVVVHYEDITKLEVGEVGVSETQEVAIVTILKEFTTLLKSESFRYFDGRLVLFNELPLYELYVNAKRYYLPDLTSGGSELDSFKLSVDGLDLLTVYESSGGSWQNSQAGIKTLVRDINIAFRNSPFHDAYTATVDLPDVVTVPDNYLTQTVSGTYDFADIIDFYGDVVIRTATEYVPSPRQYIIENTKKDFTAEPIFQPISGFIPNLTVIEAHCADGSVNDETACIAAANDYAFWQEELTTRDSTGFSVKSPGPISNWFESGEWGIFLNETELETQPYQIVYPGYMNNLGVNTPLTTPDAYNQQSHYEVSDAISRIGSTFIIDSEKGTDLLSSLADIVPGKSLLPGNLGHPHAISNIRKPQKWRIKFQFNDMDASLSVYVATPYQIQDDGTLTRTQGRDGTKGSSSRMPGELCEVSYDLSAHNNKVKEPFFNRRGKTNFDVENSYPMSYRLTCTDHGTAFFVGDQGAIDQDDDYAWFVVQRHADQTSGAIEMEDGKSPVHCVYSPAKRPEEFSDVSQNFFKSVLTTPNSVMGADGNLISSEFNTLTSIEGLQEQAIYDVTGRKLSVDLETTVKITTMLSSVVPGRYFQGTQFLDSSYHDGTINQNSEVLYNFAALPTAVVSDVSHTGLFAEGGEHSPGGLSHGMNTTYLDPTGMYYQTNATKSVFDLWYENAPARTIKAFTYDASLVDMVAGTYTGIPIDTTASLEGIPLPEGYDVGDDIPQSKVNLDGDTSSKPRSSDYFPEFLEVSSQFMTHMGNSIGKIGFKYDSIISEYKPVPLVNLMTSDYKKTGPAKQGLHPYKVWLYELVKDSNDEIDIYETSVVSSVYQIPVGMFDTIEKQVPKNGVSLNESEYLKFITFDGSLTTFDVTGVETDRDIPLSSDFNDLRVEAVPGNGAANGESGSSTSPVTIEITWGGSTFTGTSSVTLGDFEYHINEAIADLDVSMLGKVWYESGKLFWDYGIVVVSLTEGGTIINLGNITDAVAVIPGPSKVFGFGVEYLWKGSGNGGVYINPYGLSGDKTKPVKDLARLTVTVNNQELEMVPTSNINFISNGVVEFPQDYTFQGTSLNSYIYYNDLLYLRYEVDNGTVVSMKYQNYSEEDVSVQNSYMIKLAEDRDMPNSWTNLHKFGKGIYRFVVRESDVLKPWDYHVSAVLPQIDSPAIINPMEQLSITQDKSFVFNFPTPMSSQRYIYPASEMDMICYSGADSSIQGGYTEVGQTGNEKYDLDELHESLASNPTLSDDTSVTPHISRSSNGDKLTFRGAYTWHLPSAEYDTLLTYSTVAGRLNQKSHVDRRVYVGTYSTKPYGAGMRIFVQINGGSIRPEYSDNIDRKVLSQTINTVLI